MHLCIAPPVLLNFYLHYPLSYSFLLYFYPPCFSNVSLISSLLVPPIFNRVYRITSQLWKPHYLIAVPRLFETIHKGVVGNLRQQSQASQFKCRLISTLTACTQLYLRFLKTWSNLLVRAKKPSAIERVRLYYACISMDYHHHYHQINKKKEEDDMNIAWHFI